VTAASIEYRKRGLQFVSALVEFSASINLTAGPVVRIRIIKEPPKYIEGISFEQYRLGEVLDVSARLANLLVVGGYATFESRDRTPDNKDRKS
jgi:hypothetical protein